VSELLPTGTVTLLLADVEGSTRLWETQPEEMTAAFALLDRTLAKTVAAHNGVRPVEQGEGDSFVVAFARASDAVACALDLQRAQLAPIKLRIGIHTGEVQLRDEANYIGPTINKTARVRDLGHGSQTLLSGATEEMMVDRLPPGAWLSDLGAYPLRGVARPERIVQLCHPDVRNDFPPLRSANHVVSHNLPAQLTSFIGRGEQIVEVRRQLAQNRLVTLTGAGGAGKTRLALQVAAQMVDEFGSGVWFVDLAPITDPRNVPVTAARALGLPEQTNRSELDTLTRFIGDRRMLMVLDNCEHLIGASAELAGALLGACPELTLLATSREPLGVTGEVTWRVPSLSIEDEAIELFTDRACRARPHFRINGHTATVTEICRRLDGMPLAIELAAARVRSLSLAEIAGSLHDRFHLLTGGARTLMARQQTLRASVDWSHALLSEAERILFRRLAVFVGGFDLDSAHAVAAARELEPYEVLDQITLLVDKSLVVTEDHPGRTRYRMLETVRQYAAEKLDESGEGDTVRKRHLDYYLAMVKLLGTRVRSTPGHRRSQAEMQQLLEHAMTEIDNLRDALAWSIDLEPDPDTLVKAASAAAWLIDLKLAERLADAAIRAGAGPEANLIRGYALSWLGRGQQADAVLDSDDLTSGHDARLAFMQATNRLFTLADAAGSMAVIDRLSQAPAAPSRSCVNAFLAVYRAAMGQPEAAQEAAQTIGWNQLPHVAERATRWAMAVAFGEAGRMSDAVAAAEAGYPIPIRGYFVISDAHVGALVMAGRIDDAQEVAELFSRRVPAEMLKQFQPISVAVSGRAALASGDLHTAALLLESACKTFEVLGESQGWGYRTQLPRTTALGVSAMAGEAAASLDALNERRHPAWRHLDYEYAIARAWVAACQDAVSEAIATLLSAAETARANGQFAAEVMCLQTATQFGDGSSAQRLRELAAIVEGPRAGLAARFAAALDSGDGAGLASVSDDFEQMGDLIAALDAAAHAAIAFDQQKLREPALECAARAEALADRCGAMTPALRQISSIGR
jgi:predicted ATPase/class 3 adenylate cyclase